MSPLNASDDSKTLPKPIALTPDQLVKVAAGTGGLIVTSIPGLAPNVPLIPILAGPFPVGPTYGGYTVAF